MKMFISPANYEFVSPSKTEQGVTIHLNNSYQMNWERNNDWYFLKLKIG